MANSLSSIVAGMSGEREMYVTYLPEYSRPSRARFENDLTARVPM